MKGLIIVDVQNDFCSGGALEVKGSKEIFPVLNEFIDKFQESDDFIVATLDWHPKNHGSFASNSNGKVGEVGELNGVSQVWWPDHCIENTYGSELHKSLNPVENIIYKGQDPNYDSYSGFFDTNNEETGLHQLLQLKYIDTLFISGLALDYCVKYTVLDALHLGYKVYLLKDGCKGVNISPEDSKIALKEMEKAGAIII